MADLPVVRDAAAADLDRCVTTLAASHRDHPWDRWALTGRFGSGLDDGLDADAVRDTELDVEARLRRLTDAWFRLLVLPRGQGRVADGGHAVAVWIPHDAPPPEPDVAEALDALATEMLAERAPLVAEVETEVRAHRPPEPHVVLATLGTDPTHQRRGLASALLHDQLARFDQRGVLTAVETSSVDNVRFYGGFGFEVTASLTELPHDAPPTWIQVRTPR